MNHAITVEELDAALAAPLARAEPRNAPVTLAALTPDMDALDTWTSPVIAKAKQPLDLYALAPAALVQFTESNPRATERELHLADALALALGEVDRMTRELRGY